jgi:NNP family nitrate/nitrite transporter-like MFS transporter
MRVIAGPLSDKWGGARVTQLSAIGLIGSVIAVTFFTSPTSMDSFPAFVGCMLAVFFFCGVGNASTFKQMPMIFPPRQAGGVIGFTGAIAAYGPFFVSMLIGTSISMFGSVNNFFYLAAVFFFVNLVINWWYYARAGAKHKC